MAKFCILTFNFTTFAVASSHYILLLFGAKFHCHCCKPRELPDFDIMSGLIQKTLVGKTIEIIILSLKERPNFVSYSFYGFKCLPILIQIVSIQMKSEKFQHYFEAFFVLIFVNVRK